MKHIQTITFLLGVAASYMVCSRQADRREQNGDDTTDVAYDPADDVVFVDTELNSVIGVDNMQRIVFANATAAALFGVDVTQMMGNAVTRFIKTDAGVPGQTGNNGCVKPPGRTTNVATRRFTDHQLTGLHVSGRHIALETSVLHRAADSSKLAIILVRDSNIRQQMRARLARSHEELRQLSAALQTIREQERTYISRELHDDLGQLLGTLRLDLDLLQRSQDMAAHNAGLISRMQDTLASSIASLRRMATHLRPRALDDGDLYAALRGLRDEFARRYHFSCTLYADESELQLDDATSTVVFRIIQEALTNIARHADAQNVTLSIYRIDSELLVTIRDDGRGITPTDMKKSGALGLIGMRERVWGLNGHIHVTSDKLSGTCIDIVIPLSGNYQ